MSETGCTESICSLSGIWACCSCVYVCVCVLYLQYACTPCRCPKLLKGDNFPLITLMRYSAAVLSVISTLLGRTTHTLHMLADCQKHSHTLITENASYEEMKKGNEKAGVMVKRARKLSPFYNLCIFYQILPWQLSTSFTVPHCVASCRSRLINKGGKLRSQKLLKQLESGMSWGGINKSYLFIH